MTYACRLNDCSTTLSRHLTAQPMTRSGNNSASFCRRHIFVCVAAFHLVCNIMYLRTIRASALSLKAILSQGKHQKAPISRLRNLPSQLPYCTSKVSQIEQNTLHLPHILSAPPTAFLSSARFHPVICLQHPCFYWLDLFTPPYFLSPPLLRLLLS